MAALDNIASELLKAANVADLNFKKTRDQAERDKAVRLRRIVENLKAISAGGLTPNLDEVLTEGNTSTNTLDVGGITTDYVQLDTAATPTLAVGMTRWNASLGVPETRLGGGNVTGQHFLEGFIVGVNKTGATLNESEFRVVRIRSVAEGGAQGQRLAVVLAQADSDANSATTIGIVTETVPNNQQGLFTTNGDVNEIDTTGAMSWGGSETWVDGDILYLSPDHAGYLTKVKPIAPKHMIVVGWVVYAHAVHGKIFVKVDNGYELDELHNVRITSVANNDLLQYDSTLQVWKNVAASVAVPTPTLAQVTTAGNTTTNAITVGALSKVLRTGNSNHDTIFKIENVDSVGGTFGFNFATYSDGGSNRLLELGGYNTTGNIFTGVWQFNSRPVFSSGIQNNYWNNFDIVHINSNAGQAIRFISLGPTGSGGTIVSFVNNGNVLIGTTTDAGYKLDVNGTARINNNLILTNSTYAGTFTFRISAANTLIGNSVNIGDWLQVGGGNRVYILGQEFNSTSRGNIFGNTVGGEAVGIANIIAQSSGTTDLFGLRIRYAINNTGTYSGVVRGIYYNPTLTSLTGTTHRAIETVSGDVVFGSTSGSVVVAATSVANMQYGEVPKLYVNGGSYLNGNVQLGTSAIRVSGNNITWESTGITNNLPEWRADATGVKFGNYLSLPLRISVNGVENARFFSTGNISIGTTTDAGYKLDVNGTARVNGRITAGNASTAGEIYSNPSVGMTFGSGQTTNTFTFIQMNSGRFQPQGSVEQAHLLMIVGQAESSNQENRGSVIRHTGTVSTSNGNAIFSNFQTNNVINTTGGTTIYRGFYHNPTLTSLTGTTHRAIETVTGDVIFGSTSGNVGIGTTSPATKLDITGAHVSSIGLLRLNSTAGNISAQTYYIDGSYKAAIYAGTDNNFFLWGRAGDILLTTTTSNTERMRITSGGNVLINTTTDTGEKLQVNGSIKSSALTINGPVLATGGVLSSISGYTGLFTVPTNPPGMQTLDIQNGIIVNVL